MDVSHSPLISKQLLLLYSEKISEESPLHKPSLNQTQ